MELLFICPELKKDFATTKWGIEGSLETVSLETGQISLDGEIKAFCPYCQKEHIFRPGDLPCPFKS
ncbi:MAG: hypothetical protein D5R98_03450 [Desulfonatronovibrio sp. MSAO_Bac4]|nr:MAG: hypothetical protein D5R98_03450 [Desulfonatronovibrio sp. MSAO_Bac4]